MGDRVDGLGGLDGAGPFASAGPSATADLLDPDRGAVPGFRPSVHGLRFANTFPPGPTLVLGPLDVRRLGVGDASAGLCGGMALTTRDLFEAGIPVPSDTEPPVNGSRRFRALVRRQVESLDWLRVPLRFWAAQAQRHDAAVAARSATHQWPRIRAVIDGGSPAVVGLVRSGGRSPWRLAGNHQVLAWAYETTPDRSRLWLYDPNHPGRDDVTVELVRLGAGWSAHQSTGEPLRGFFALPYRRAASGAWRSWRDAGDGGRRV